jgi:transcriptional regulator with XRE-family HTH domain
MVNEPPAGEQQRQALGARLAGFRAAAGLTQGEMGRLVYRDRTTVNHIEKGRSSGDEQFWRDADRAVKAGGVLLAAFIELEAARAEHEQQRRDAELVAARARVVGWQGGAEPPQSCQVDPAVLHGVEALRRNLADAVDHAAMSDASLDDWEHVVHQYGLATRYRAAGALLVDLAADFAELCRLLERRRAILVPRRLTRVMAQIAGLMSLTLIKLDQRAAARNWARTAKLIADEAGDSTLHAWVRAQEAYACYYSGNLPEAVYVAAHAQHIARQAPCAGVALAAALEARAHAVCGRAAESSAALALVERLLGRLDADARQPSAFGYNEAQFRFHAGNAYTHLGETTAAYEAQDRALALYPDSDYLDRALVKLDRAECLARDNDLTAAASWAVDALHGAGNEQPRDQLLDNRARQVLGQVSATAAALPAVQELHELLVVSPPQ